jgi:hypothetical protein
VTGILKKIPLGTRYAIGLIFVFTSGLVTGFGAQLPVADDKKLWVIMTVIAVTHWLTTALYLWWEKRWYRYFIFVFSTLASCSYMELSMRVWRES